MIVLGVPLVLGLLWNKWAGGAAGFITGGMYYVASAGLLHTDTMQLQISAYNFFGDMSMLAGSLYGCHHRLHGWSIKQQINEFQTNVRCRLNSCSNSCDNPSLLQLHIHSHFRRAMSMNHGIGQDTSLGVAGIYGFVLAFVPSIALGVIVPIIAKVMTWYGLQPMRH